MTVKNLRASRYVKLPGRLPIKVSVVAKSCSLFLCLIIVSGQLAVMQPLNANVSKIDALKNDETIVAFNESNPPLDEVDKQLNDIITSEDYATPKEHRVLKLKEDSLFIKFLKDIIKFLLGGEKKTQSSPFLGVLPAIVKIALVLALIFFVVWVVKHASKKAWFQTLNQAFGNKARISSLTPSQESQKWQALPSHTQIPEVVQGLIAQKDYEQAASILYRGSLRWLIQTQNITIVPATTEKQCLNQIEHLSTLTKNDNHPSSNLSDDSVYQSNQQPNQQLTQPSTHQAQKQSKQRVLSLATVNYLTALIYVWLEVAYSQTLRQKSSLLESRLYELTNEWLKKLPQDVLPVLDDPKPNLGDR